MNNSIEAFEKFARNFQALVKMMPELMEQLAVGEGVHAVAEAKRICKQEDIVGRGDYRDNWESDEKATRRGHVYSVRVFNTCEYATHLEYGFRPHFVPGHWDGKSFVYVRGAKEGMYVVGKKHPVILGHHTLQRASKHTRRTQAIRLQRKAEKFFREKMEGKS